MSNTVQPDSTHAPQSTNPVLIPTNAPIPDGFSEAPPPWPLEAEAWWIFPSVPLPWQAKELPKGALDPIEAEKLNDLQATYKGGLGTVQLIRYHSTPVGPYDELLYVPGVMSYKVGASTVSGLSVTRIYVSTTASVVNGRRNWNIPKHLARFEFTRETPSDPLSPVIASVYPALRTNPDEYVSEPVFRARLSPSRRLPTVPLNLARVPHVLLDPHLLQAPLSAAGGATVGTEQWCTVIPDFSGQIQVMYPEAGLNGKFGDGVGFPDFQPLSFGLYWPKASIMFSKPDILDLEEDKKTK